MGAQRSVIVSDWIDQINFELRNTSNTQYPKTELLNYLNKWLEFINHVLIEAKSELVRTGNGTITTVSGTETYSLAANNMGDFYAPHRIWISGEDAMEQTSEDDRYDYLQASESGSPNNSKPIKYYIEGDNIGLLPFPDDVYTVNIKYYPDFVLLADTDNLPLRNLFNLQLQEGVMIIAKNRENVGSAVDSALMELFRDRCLSIMHQREQHQISFTPVINGD